VHAAATLDSALKERLRAVLADEPVTVTEAELRKLAEEGRACALILSGQLERGERRLAHLSSDPSSSFADIADTFRRVSEVGTDLDELRTLLADLQGRAREVRAAWL
jgi:hypothetical protein